MGSAEAPPPPQQINPGRDLIRYVNGMQTALPQLLGLEGAHRGAFGALNLADISGLLNGQGGQTGLLGLGGQANQASQGQLDAARGAEFQSMLGNAGTVRGILGAVDPTGQAAVNRAGQAAETAYQRSIGPLTPEDRRTADQTAREAFSARGRINDNAAVMGEVLGREDMRRSLRQEASQANSAAFGMGQQFSQPALSLLGGSPASVLLGQDYLNAGRGAVGQNVPQLIDTGAASNVGAQNAANRANWSSNVASVNNANAASTNQNIGTAIGSLAMMAAAFSDKKVKKNIKRVGKTDEGLPIYTYNLMGSPKTEMGVMAQEVKKKQPDALGPKMGGLMTVDYAKIN